MFMFGLIFLVAAAASAPQFVFNSQPELVFNGQQQFVSSGKPEIRIVSQKNIQDQIGNYEYAYEQNNGQKVEEVGKVEPGSQPETGRIEQQGYYEYVADDGNTYRVTYIANEGGFQPQAAHLPVAPVQIPEYAQLRRDYPQLFWAESGSSGIIVNSQPQFVQQPQLNLPQFVF